MRPYTGKAHVWFQPAVLGGAWACKDCGICRNVNNAETLNCPGVVKVTLRDDGAKIEGTMSVDHAQLAKAIAQEEATQ